MVCLGLEPGVAGWKAQTNPLSYSGTPSLLFLMGQPGPLLLFLVFSNKHHYSFLQLIYVKKCPSSIWCRDLNPQPLEHESPTITSKPGLLPNNQSSLLFSNVPEPM